jgi:biotin carboxyl carrier protein
MKMEHVVRAPATGRVVSVHYNVGDLVELKKLLISMETNSAAAPKSK